MASRMVTIDGNEAVARVAYQLSEVIAILQSRPPRRWANGRMNGLLLERPTPEDSFQPLSKCKAKEALQGRCTARCRRVPWRPLLPRRKVCC